MIGSDEYGMATNGSIRDNPQGWFKAVQVS